MITISGFDEAMRQDGYFLFPNVLTPVMINNLKVELERCYIYCRNLQLAKGISDITEGTVHHLAPQAKIFLQLLEHIYSLDEFMAHYFGGKYILNSYGGNILKRGSSYANNVHRDIRSFSGELPLMLNSIVMLDDFTANNGATWLMNGGHKLEKKPTDQIFKTFAKQITGRSGSVLFFNSNLWHMAGENKSDKPRRSLTPMYCRPFIKPQFDYSQSDPGKYSPYLQQVLGYNARIPETLSEWYAKPQDRMYKGDQG